MAEELSEDTKAIIARLTREGLLTRNEGVNSIKSLNIKFDKFSGILKSINTNIISQNAMVAKQLEIQYDAATAARDQEQYAEIGGSSSDSSSSPSTSDSKEDDKTYKVIDKIGENIKSAFSLKNIALGTAGMFVGYNLLKGFVDEKTNGGFTAFESNIGRIITDIGNVDFSKFAPSMETLVTTIDSLKAAVDKISETITRITEFGWGDLFGALWNTMGAITAYNLTMSVINRVMARRAGRIGGPGAKRGLLRTLIGGGLGVGAIAASGAFTQDEVDAERARAAQEKADLDRARANQAQYSRGAPGNADYTPRAAIMPDANGNVTTKSGNTVAANSPQGRMVMTAGGTQELTPDQRAALGGYDNYRTPPAATPRANANRNVAAVADSGGAVGQEVLKQNKDKIARSVASKIGRVFIKAVPGLGMLAGAGFALWSLARGDFTTAALEAASIPAPSLAGAPLDVGAIATAVFFEITGETYNQGNEDHRAIMIGIGEEVAKQWEEWKAKRQQEGRDFEQRTNEMAANERLAMGGATAFADSGYAPEISQSLGTNYYTGESSGSLASSPGFRGNYYQDRNGIMMYQSPDGKIMRASERPNVSSLEGGANGGGGVVLQNNTSAPSYITNVSKGGDTVAVNQSSFGGGGDGSPTNFYNLPGGIQ